MIFKSHTRKKLLKKKRSTILREAGQLSHKYRERLDAIKQAGELNYRRYRKRKPSGGYRVISVPSDSLKQLQKDMLIDLQYLIWISKHATGFRPGKSPVSNALVHGSILGGVVRKEGRLIKSNTFTSMGLTYQVTKEEMLAFSPKEGIGMDIKDAFGSINMKMITKGIRTSVGAINAADLQLIEEACLSNNKLPQGAPTSPFLLNVALVPFDRYLNGLIKSKISDRFKTQYAYTRFADDITITTMSPVIARKAIKIVYATAKHFKLKVNKRKTRIMTLRTGIFITGINVVNSGSHYSISRAERDRMKAAIHELQHADQKDSDYDSKYFKLLGRISYLYSVDSLHGAKLISKALDAGVIDADTKFAKKTAAQILNDTNYFRQRRKQFFSK